MSALTTLLRWREREEQAVRAEVRRQSEALQRAERDADLWRDQLHQCEVAESQRRASGSIARSATWEHARRTLERGLDRADGTLSQTHAQRDRTLATWREARLAQRGLEILVQRRAQEQRRRLQRAARRELDRQILTRWLQQRDQRENSR